MMVGNCNLLYLVIIAVVFNSVTANYCNVGSCGHSHTMCRYQSPSPSGACGRWSNNGLSNDERNVIVNKHNELRRRVASGQETRGWPGPQPGAGYMPDLTWDDELAMIAQRWANQCNFNHDQCRNVGRFAVGQNLAILSYYGNYYWNAISSLQGMIQRWYDEVASFNRNHVYRYVFNPATGHYTQMVWASTTRIGCGQIRYTKPDGWTSHLLVCNYGPSGNWIGQRVY